MIWAVIAIGGVIIGAITTPWILFARKSSAVESWHAAADAHAREIVKLTNDLMGEKAAHDVTKAELVEAKRRLVAAEKQRNNAWTEVREHVAKQLADSDVAGAADLGNRLLSQPLPDLHDLDSDDTALEKP